MTLPMRWIRPAFLAGALAVCAAIPAAGGRDAAALPAREPLVLTVRYGDSLWTLARRYGDPSRDVREVIWRVKQANTLGSGPLQPGTALLIPADCLPREPRR